MEERDGQPSLGIELPEAGARIPALNRRSSHTFRGGVREPEGLFVPSSPEIRLPADHFVRSLLALTEKVLGSELRSRSVLWGGFPYDPVGMFCVLMYALMLGERSSRRMEDKCLYDTRFIFLLQGMRPDHSTIARFRRRLDADGGLDKLMLLVVEEAAKAGLVKGKTAVVDGTKMPTSGSQWRKYIEATEGEDAEVEVEAKSPPEDPPKPESPPSAKRGRKPKGKTKAKTRSKPGQRRMKSSWDKDARTLKTTHGEYIEGYNLQLAVDASRGIVLGALATNASQDLKVLGDVLAAMRKQSGVSPRRVLADKGYESSTNLKAVAKIRAKSYIIPKDRKPFPFQADAGGVLRCHAGHKATSSHTTKDGVPYLTYRVSQCKDCLLKAACGKTSTGHQREMNVRDDEHLKASADNRRRCNSVPGKAQSRIRGQTVERANARIKRDLRMTRLHLKGLAGARIELLLACLTLNVQTLLTHLRRLINMLLCLFLTKRTQIPSYCS